MSSHPPSYFLQQSEDYQDNPLDPSMFDESNLDYLFADDQPLAYPDGLVSGQNAIPEITEQHSSSHEVPQGDFTNEEHQLESDYDELMREQEAISRMLETFAAQEPSSLDDANESLSIQESQYEVEESVEDQGGVSQSSLPNSILENNSANHGQQQVGLPNDRNQEQVEPKAFGEFHAGTRKLQCAGNTVVGGTPAFPDAVADDEQRIQKRLQKAKQTATSKPRDRRRRPATQRQIKPAHNASGPQGDLETSAAGHDLQATKKGEASEVNTPGVDSGYGTLNPSPEAMEPANSGQDINTNDEAVTKAKSVRVEADPNFDPANDLNHYPEDPETGVTESRQRPGWGRTGLRNGVEVWFNPYTEEWVESASHHSYREILIARAQAEHPDRRYLHPDQADELAHSETAFFLSHENLGPDRDDCPDECFAFPTSVPDSESEDEEAENKGQAKKKRKSKPRARQYGPDPGFWFEDKVILLDPHNNPVKKHLDIPLTLSAHAEGYKMDLMRILNASISQKDLWARMPRWIRKQAPKTHVWYTGYIGHPNTHVNMPSQRFREEKGAIAAQARDGSKNLREGLKEYLLEHGFDPSATGSTRGFGRDLLPWEQDLVKLKNRGKHPERAGKRALDEETREKNNQKLLKKIEKGRKKLEADAAQAGRTFGKRPRDDENGDVQNPNPTPKTENLGRRLHEARGMQVSLQPQRYGTPGAPSSRYQNPNVHHGTHGVVGFPFQNTNAFGGNWQAPFLSNGQNVGTPSISSHPSVGLPNNARLNTLRQGFSGQTRSTQAPVHSGYYPEGQYRQQHSRMEGIFPARPKAPHTAQQVHLPQNVEHRPVHGLDRFEGESVHYAPPRPIGNRDRSHAESGPPENSLGPGGKRRRMPGTDGNNLLPGTQRGAEKKLLGSKRDEHLPPPVFNIDDSGRYTNQAHQVAISVEAGQTIPITSQVPHVAVTQGPRVPIPVSAAHMPARDVRDMPPANEWECERLQEALSCTRWAFAQWTGMNAPETNRFDCYNVQFKFLFDAFYRWWNSRSNPERSQPVEWLLQVEADLKPPTDDGLVYECVRRGFYAPRNADGSLQ